ncbi:MAG: hypothetical protein H7Z75_10460, partial [Ferruginibacter sp.]|nr:hypothetical protein [Cytophagales bacterium]
QFVIKPKDDIVAPLWIARLNILNTSNIRVTAGGGTALEAVATLNGSMDINANLRPLSVVNFKAMEFEELVVQTKAPYLKVKTFKAGLASPQKSVGGFPVSLKDPEMILTTDQAGLRFTMDMDLAGMATLPKASCTFDLLGKISFAGGRPDWGWDKPEVKVSRISLDGPVGPVKVKGFVEFFDGDATYGNGVRGGLKAEMMAGLELEANAMFGRKEFSYWYVDARLKLPPPGIPLSPPVPLSAFGFGGGAFYNLKQKNLPTAQELFDEKFTVTDLYEPAAGNVGFSATIILGMSDGELFQAEGKLITVIDVRNMAVRSVEINVKTAQLAALMKTKDAAIKGYGIIRYDFAQNIFEASIGTEVDVKAVMKGSSWLSFHVNGGSKQWFIKIGEPDHPNSFPMYGFASFNSYFMAGSAGLLPEMPLPPSEVIRQTGYAGSRPFYAEGQMRGLKLAFGANMQFTDQGPQDFSFLIFYARLGAGIGFDLTLQQFQTGCDGTANNLPGINGWYANGQLWAWLYGEAGIELDAWFFKGRATILKVGAAALLRAGLPNPVWFEGWFGGEYNVLGGLVKGNLRFNVNFNQEKKCVPEANPFVGDPLISQINPTGEGISIMANPQVAFNFPVDKDLDFVLQDRDGNDRLQRFKLVITQYELVNTKTGVVEFGIGKNSEVVVSHDNYLASLFTTVALNPQTNYRVVINVKVQEWVFDGNRYRDYVFPSKGGKVVQQSDDRTTFKTGDCVKNLAEQHTLLASYPFNGQRFVLQDEERNGKLMLQKPVPCLFGDNVYEVVAKFTSFGPSGNQEQEVPVAMGLAGKELNFRLPRLPNDAITLVRFVQKRKPKAAGNQLATQVVSAFRTQNLYARDVAAVRQPEFLANTSTIETRRTSLSGTSLTEKAFEEIEIYRYFFKTSKFNVLSDKLANANDEVNAVKTSAVGILESYDVAFDAAEGFDVFDVSGGTYQNDVGKQFAIRPIVHLAEEDRWYKNYAGDYLYKSYWLASLGGYYGISLANARDLVGNYGGAPPTGPVNLVSWSAEPPLSQSEIRAVSAASKSITNETSAIKSIGK